MFIVDELKTKANGLIPGIDRPTVLNYYIRRTKTYCCENRRIATTM